MTKGEIEIIVSRAYRRRSDPVEIGTRADFERLSSYFGCEFPDEYRHLVSLMGQYSFEGIDFLLPRPQDNSDGIIEIYESESRLERRWDSDLIPLVNVGNGDYVCIRSSKCPNSPVYYVSHEDDSIEELHKNLAAFVSDKEWMGQ